MGYRTAPIADIFNMARKQKTRKQKKTTMGMLFWIAFILLILVLFLFNKENIEYFLQSTGFIKSVDKTITKTKKEIKVTEKKNDETKKAPSVQDKQDNDTIEIKIKDTSEDNTEILQKENGTSSQDANTRAQETIKENTETQQTGEKKNVRNAKLYFIQVTDDGNIHLRAITRKIYFNESPMTQTLKSLIEGPSADELNQGLISLLPKNSELLSAYVKNGIAYLNFNEQFRFNQMKMEGYKAQLEQVVYTVTEFSTVEKVQFLINGKIVDYLDAESPFVGKPFGRDML